MTKIIATVGPSTEDESSLKKLIKYGACCFRLNFSHGNHNWHKSVIEKIRKIDNTFPILLDTKGPEIRTSSIIHPIILNKEDILNIVCKNEDEDQENNIIFVNYKNLYSDIETNDIISLNSGMVEVVVTSKNSSEIKTKVIKSGVLGKGKQHVNLVQKDVSLPTITEEDKKDILFGIENNIDIIALSFLRSEKGVKEVREIFSNYNKNVKIFSKIETQLAMDNLEEISKISDGLMVARGDLGVETPLELIPKKQKEIIKISKKYNKEVIVATEMLESMINNPRPTRAEVSDIALAVEQNSDFVMLSAETASGKYPFESVKIMKKIIDVMQ
jgi:pyruvate kinase